MASSSKSPPARTSSSSRDAVVGDSTPAWIVKPVSKPGGFQCRREATRVPFSQSTAQRDLTCIRRRFGSPRQSSETSSSTTQAAGAASLLVGAYRKSPEPCTTQEQPVCTRKALLYSVVVFCPLLPASSLRRNQLPRRKYGLAAALMPRFLKATGRPKGSGIKTQITATSHSRRCGMGNNRTSMMPVKSDKTKFRIYRTAAPKLAALPLTA